MCRAGAGRGPRWVTEAVRHADGDTLDGQAAAVGARLEVHEAALGMSRALGKQAHGSHRVPRRAAGAQCHG